MTNGTWYTSLTSPIGPLLLVGDGDALAKIEFGVAARRGLRDARESRSPFRSVLAQLEAYFAGELREFDLPLVIDGTAFQSKVWRALGRIPYGETISYGELARRVGKPGASRAVGNANGRNRLPIVLPCHRVIAADGSLGGYGGGLAIKKKLLALEGAWPG